MNPEAIESHLTKLLSQWMIIITVAWVFGRLGRKIGQPLAVGEILAGLLLGPSALGLVWPKDWAPLFPAETQQSLQLLGKLGVILLLFQVPIGFGNHRHDRPASSLVLARGAAAIGPLAHGKAACRKPSRHANRKLVRASI